MYYHLMVKGHFKKVPSSSRLCSYYKEFHFDEDGVITGPYSREELLDKFKNLSDEERSYFHNVSENLPAMQYELEDEYVKGEKSYMPYDDFVDHRARVLDGSDWTYYDHFRSIEDEVVESLTDLGPMFSWSKPGEFFKEYEYYRDFEYDDLTDDEKAKCTTKRYMNDGTHYDLINMNQVADMYCYRKYPNYPWLAAAQFKAVKKIEDFKYDVRRFVESSVMKVNSVYIRVFYGKQ